MPHDYEIFECLSDGSVRWLEQMSGLIKARRSLRELVESSNAEYFAIELPTRQVLFPTTAPALDRRAFQIAYTTELCKQRARVLRNLGYGVLSVVGNAAAENLLTTLQPDARDITLFMVGHRAPEKTRNEMVQWLKSRYPAVKIIALNSPNQKVTGADHNVVQNGPELWLHLLPATNPTRSESE